MPTARPVLDTRYQSKDKTYPVIVRLRHLNQTREIPTGWKIEEKFWKEREVSGKHPDAMVINERLADLLAQAKKFYAQCQLDGRRIDLKLFGSFKSSHSFITYLRTREKHYDEKDMVIMRRKVARLILELTGCFGQEMYFEDFTLDALRQFDVFLTNAGNNDTTRHKKVKILRQFFQTGAKECSYHGPNNFALFKIKAKPVRKEKLTIEEFRSIEELKLKDGPLKHTRDLFLFSYYTKGARFETCVILHADQVSNGRIYFKTNKGQKYLSVKIHVRLQKLLDQYNRIGFIFPFVKELREDAEGYVNQIGVLNATVNRDLKKVAALAGVTKTLTFHIARHTFAFHLKGTSDSIHVIKDALGHSDSRTTEIYLQSLDDEVLDKEMDKLYG